MPDSAQSAGGRGLVVKKAGDISAFMSLITGTGHRKKRMPGNNKLRSSLNKAISESEAPFKGENRQESNVIRGQLRAFLWCNQERPLKSWNPNESEGNHLKILEKSSLGRGREPWPWARWRGYAGSTERGGESEEKAAGRGMGYELMRAGGPGPLPHRRQNHGKS